MEIIFIIMPIALFIGLLFFAALMWAIKSGQWDDLVRPAHRILDDDDDDKKVEGKQSPFPPGSTHGRLAR
ncbi:MAG: cbb3-type cytochrome oxidase assembly protein CcoS [Nitrospirota bacterium]|nr:cbb3-type cytochrome oxidase assembly protein CcoS [Nitrospirota bacterium]